LPFVTSGHETLLTWGLRDEATQCFQHSDQDEHKYFSLHAYLMPAVKRLSVA